MQQPLSSKWGASDTTRRGFLLLLPGIQEQRVHRHHGETTCGVYLQTCLVLDSGHQKQVFILHKNIKKKHETVKKIRASPCAELPRALQATQPTLHGHDCPHFSQHTPHRHSCSHFSQQTPHYHDYSHFSQHTAHSHDCSHFSQPTRHGHSCPQPHRGVQNIHMGTRPL